MSMRDLLPKLIQPLSKLWFSMNPGARVLMYHRVATLPEYDQLTVTPERFREQILWLKNNALVVPFDDVVKGVKNKDIKKNIVAITFDDGYLDNLQIALPILEELSIPATIYITSEFASQEKNHSRYPASNQRLHLNWQEIRQLSEHPLITIGSHTVTHPMLSSLNNQASMIEIVDSKKQIEDQISVACEHFCFPAGNYSERELGFVRQAGYSSAVTVKPGRNAKTADIMAIRRTEITDKDTINNMRTKMDGAFDLFHHLLDMKRELQFRQHRKQNNPKQKNSGKSNENSLFND